jgi:hypothetical protein
VQVAVVEEEALALGWAALTRHEREMARLRAKGLAISEVGDRC